MSWTNDPRRQLGRSVIAAGCLYEITALYTRLPTITRITGQSWHWRRPYGPVALLVAAAAAVAHFASAVRAAGVAMQAAHDMAVQ